MVSINNVVQAHMILTTSAAILQIFGSPEDVLRQHGFPDLGVWAAVVSKNMIAMGLGSQLLLLGFALAPTAVQKSAVRGVLLWFAVLAAGHAATARVAVAPLLVAFAAFAAAYYASLGGAGFPAPRPLPPGPLKTCLLVNAGACALFALAGTVFVGANLASLGLVPGTPAYDGVRRSQQLDAVQLVAHAAWARELALTVGDAALARRALFAWAAQAAACAYVTYTDAPAGMMGSQSFVAQLAIIAVLGGYTWLTAWRASGDDSDETTASAVAAGAQPKRKRAE